MRTRRRDTGITWLDFVKPVCIAARSPQTAGRTFIYAGGTRQNHSIRSIRACRSYPALGIRSGRQIALRAGEESTRSLRKYRSADGDLFQDGKLALVQCFAGKAAGRSERPTSPSPCVAVLSNGRDCVTISPADSNSKPSPGWRCNSSCKGSRITMSLAGSSVTAVFILAV